MYELTHRDAPWLTRDAIALLENWLAPEFVGLEWGAGRSTLWFARRVAALITVEHAPDWFARVRRQLQEQEYGNVTLLLEGERSHGYLAAAHELDDNLLDFALVDGVRRDECAWAVLPKIRPGGFLIIDDAHRYFPTDSRSPLALRPGGEPPTPIWGRVQHALASWECTWTSDGVRDTAFWRKPADDPARPN